MSLADLSTALGNVLSKRDVLTQDYTPVSPREFLTSSYYTGYEKGEIYDFWIKEITDFFDGDYNELIIVGSLGSGKTTAANVLLTYAYYKLFSYSNINAYFGLPRISDVYNIYFSTTSRQAQLTGYKQFRTIVDSAPWFKGNKPRRESIDSIIEWNEGKFSVISGSTQSHAIGMTVFSFILDESDFFGKNGRIDDSYSQVTEMYDELVDRRASRFLKHGQDKSFSILVSSTSFQSSFTQKRIEAASSDPRIKVVNAVGYRIKPKGTYSDKKFFVFKGTSNVEPEIITSPSQIQVLSKKVQVPSGITGQEKTLDEALLNISPEFKYHLEDVPVDFYKEYERNLYKCLMNHSGVATVRVGRLMQSKTYLLKAYENELKHPFTRSEIELSTDDDIQLREYFDFSSVIEKEKPHAIHVDQSLSGDSTGISLVRYDGDIKTEHGYKRHFTQVFSLRINPPPAPHQIAIYKVRQFIIDLFDFGINLIKVTSDSFQSSDMRQVLNAYGINAEYQSLDRNDSAYILWLQLLQEESFSMYCYPILEKEIEEAIHDRARHKVDHPPHHSIDVFQSLVGALNNLANTNTPSYTFIGTFVERASLKTETDEFVSGIMRGQPTDYSEFIKRRSKDTARKNYLDLFK